MSLTTNPVEEVKLGKQILQILGLRESGFDLVACPSCGRAELDVFELANEVEKRMSLEALAALLGHKSLSMTLIYARIADRTVADEYFAVSERIEALYHRAQALPADVEGSKMAKLRNEMNRRMLGNGYCARPVELDCHFESICESCTFFVTTIDFKPTLERQRDDAEARGQVGRRRIFDGLLARLEQDAS